jgi:uncharacterized membrane protein
VPIVLAANSFSFGAITGEQTVCATDTVLYILPVTNGEKQDSFTVSLSGDAAKWAVAAPSGFILDPGAIEQVYVYVTPSSGALPGSYDLKVTVNGQSAGRQDQLLKVNVGDCHSASLIALEVDQEVCADSAVKYTLTLANTGKYTENFAISTTGPAAAWTTLSETVAKLKAGESKEIVATIKPAADQTGAFDLTITAKSDSNAAASAKVKVNSNNCYEFALTPDKNFFEFCENSDVTIPLTVRNNGEAANTFDLSVSGPSWASLETSSVDVASGSEKIANLKLFPGFGVSGNFDINVNAAGQQGGVSETQTITANVKTCHSTDLKIASAEDMLCPFTSRMYEVSLANTGEFDESYAITVSGANWASVDKNFVELKTGESAKFNLQIDPKDVPAEDYVLSVEAVSQGPSKTGAKDVLVTTITPKEGCFGVLTTAALTKVEVAPGDGALVPIIIENKGTEESTYNIEVSGTGAGYAQLNPATVTIEGREADTVYMYIAVPEETAQNLYKITVAARLQDGTVSSSSDVEVSVIAPGAEKPTQETTPAGSTQERMQNKLNALQSFFGGLKEKLTALVESLRAKFTSIMPQKETPEEQAPVEEPEEQAEALPPGQLELTEDEPQEITVGNETHNVTAIKADENSVSLKFESEPVLISLLPGQSKLVDLNGDGIKDIKVTYNGMKDGKADITYEEIPVVPAEEKAAEAEKPAEAAKEETPPAVPEEQPKEEAPPQEVNETEVAEPEEQVQPEQESNLSESEQALLSPALKEKLTGQKQELSNATASVTSRFNEKLGSLKGLFAGLSVGGLKTFLTQQTYIFPNWLWIVAIIIVLMVIGYFLKEEKLPDEQPEISEEPKEEKSEDKTEKGLWKKFQNFLEEEDEEKAAEEKKEVKGNNKKGKNGKDKVLIDEDKMTQEDSEDNEE